MSGPPISRTAASRSGTRKFLTWSLAVVATLVVAWTGAVGWKHVLEWHYLGMLEDGSVEERKEAARGLAAMGSRKGFERLLVLPPPEPPSAICRTDFYTDVLIEHGESVTPLLLDALNHDEIRARFRAATAIQKLHPRGATRALVEALVHEGSRDVMLNALPWQDAEPGEAIQALSVAIRSESDGMRAAAAEAFGRVKLSSDDHLPACRMLERAMSDPAPLVRIHSAWTLGDIGPRSESIPFLVTALNHEVDNVRRAAARALSLMGPAARPARDALELALEDRGSSDVRKYAGEALANIRAGENQPRR